MPEGPYRNRVLQHLDQGILRRLKLVPVALELNKELIPLQGLSDHLYFVEQGIASVTTPFRNGSEVEVGTFGFESVIGLSSLLGSKISNVRAFMQIPGHGLACSVSAARAEFESNQAFQRLMLLHVQAQFAQAAQNVACNALHKHAQRMAKWLLICSDRMDSDTLELSHEFLAQMLGSTRSTVSLAAGALRKRGLIGYSRGCIRIVHREKLEKDACECYWVARQQLDTLCKGTAA